MVKRFYFIYEERYFLFAEDEKFVREAGFGFCQN